MAEEPAQHVVITGSDAAVNSGLNAGTPAGGFATLSAGSNGQIKGTDGADKATLATVLADKDQIINLGGGDDVFVFRNNAEGLDGRINGIVIGGEGNDRAFMGGEISDYFFSIRSDGGIKIEYNGDSDAAAITFREFESFTFRGIDPQGTSHGDVTLSYQQLLDAIRSPTSAIGLDGPVY